MASVGVRAPDRRSVRVRRAVGPVEVARAIALRRAVFVSEQRLPAELEADGRDRQAVHLIALQGQELVGTCRLVSASPAGSPSKDKRAAVRLGRLAVRRDQRKGGIGRALLDLAEQEARRSGAGAVVLHAQTQAIGFYRAAGYRQHGGTFVQAGLPHVTMELELA